MTIQIFGTKKCRDTQKALRFFKERRIPVHFVNITEKPVSGGELDAFIRALGAEALLDTEAKGYASAKYRADKRECILADQTLLRTPVVRNGHLVTSGHQESTWKTWTA